MTFVATAIVCAIFLGLVVAIRVRQARTMGRLAERIGALRTASLQENSHAPVGSPDPRPAGSLQLYEAASRELALQACTVLGDLVETSSAGKTAGVARWFASQDGTVCGWFAVLGTEKGLSPVRFLFSESVTPGVYFITYSGASSVRVAHPLPIQRIEVPINQGLAAALSRHRGLLTGPAGEAAQLRSVASLEEAVALLQRLRAESKRWRATQPAEELLVADLKLILGQRFAELAPRLLPRLRGR